MWSWMANKNTFMITFNNFRRYWGEGVHTVRDRTKCQFTTSSTRPWGTYSISRDPRYLPLTAVYRFNFIIDDGIENTSFHYKSRFRVYQLRTTHRLLIYVFVFISLLPHMLPVCTRWCRRVSRKMNSLEFLHRHQFRIRASLRILNSLELKSSWSTKCTLGTRDSFLACGGNFRCWSATQ